MIKKVLIVIIAIITGNFCINAEYLPKVKLPANKKALLVAFSDQGLGNTGTLEIATWLYRHK